ncbi:MAG TPA: hypothetical protein VHG72_06085 [Polyangia bacterium]|nr:hypothetical protein [Polyangia bacterium]
MLKLYARLAGRSVRLALRGWPAAVALLLYATALQIAGGLLGQLGMVGGFLVGFVIAFLISSYLHLLSLTVAGRPIRLADFRESFGARFWDVVSVLFAIWIIELVVGLATANAGPRGEIVTVLVGLTMVVFFNPVPELIYLGNGQVRSFALLLAAARFISAHWPEWLAPTALMAAVVLAPTGLIHHGPLAARLLTMQMLFSLDGLVATVLAIPLWLKPFMLIFITWAMVFRGLLFAELASGTNRRRRAWPNQN